MKVFGVFVEIFLDFVKECGVKIGLLVCFVFFFGVLKLCVFVIDCVKVNELYLLMNFIDNEMVINFLIGFVVDVCMNIFVYK